VAATLPGEISLRRLGVAEAGTRRPLLPRWAKIAEEHDPVVSEESLKRWHTTNLENGLECRP
jgi:hypothetical protein